VGKIKDQKALIAIAFNDKNADIRSRAVWRNITNQDVLVDIASNDEDGNVS